MVSDFFFALITKGNRSRQHSCCRIITDVVLCDFPHSSCSSVAYESPSWLKDGNFVFSWRFPSMKCRKFWLAAFQATTNPHAILH